MCRGFVGNQDSYKLIMSVDVACRFVAPVLSISAKQLNYYIENVGQTLELWDSSVKDISLCFCIELDVCVCLCLTGPRRESNAPISEAGPEERVSSVSVHDAGSRRAVLSVRGPRGPELSHH